MQMPEMDGLELAEHLTARHPALPIVLLSSIGHRVQARPGLLKATLLKPIKQSQLWSALKGVLDLQANAGPPRSASLRAPSGPNRPLRILVAEDNRVNQLVLRRILESMGYGCKTVENGLAAVDTLHQGPYDVVLMDVHMPEMDGLDATQRIRAELPPEFQPRIVALTADVTQEQQTACIDAGMDDYLSKPVGREALAKALAKCPVLPSGGAPEHVPSDRAPAPEPSTNGRRAI